jgi:hypothetical protein
LKIISAVNLDKERRRVVLRQSRAPIDRSIYA